MNREIFPGSAYPLAGDVTSEAGANQVTVTGLRNIPLTVVDLDDSVAVVFDKAGNRFITRNPTSASIRVNSQLVSDDYEISVNVPKEVKVNGA